MEWTKPQQRLLSIAKEPITDGFALDIVTLKDDDAPLAAVIKEICNPKKQPENVRHIRVYAVGAWNMLMALKTAGHTRQGSGWYDTAHRVLKALSPDKKPLVLWMEECRMTSLREQETIVFLLENIAWHQEIPLRIVMLSGKTRKWIGRDEKTGEWIGGKRDSWAMSTKLAEFARVFVYANEKIRVTNATPLFNDHEEIRKVAMA